MRVTDVARLGVLWRSGRSRADLIRGVVMLGSLASAIAPPVATASDPSITTPLMRSARERPDRHRTPSRATSVTRMSTMASRTGGYPRDMRGR